MITPRIYLKKISLNLKKMNHKTVQLFEKVILLFK
jgi:hypothetical protein